MIHFLRVTHAASKLQIICEIVQDHFYRKNKIQILAPSDEAAAYIDNLLWRMPEESFIPHVIAKKTMDEPIVITTNYANLNQADILINLLPGLPPNLETYKHVYDLLDLSHPDKEKLSLQRLAAYEAAGLKVEV